MQHIQFDWLNLVCSCQTVKHSEDEDETNSREKGEEGREKETPILPGPEIKQKLDLESEPQDTPVLWNDDAAPAVQLPAVRRIVIHLCCLCVSGEEESTELMLLYL